MRFTISSDGQLIRRTLAKSSRISEFDDTAMKAIADAADFPSLPKGSDYATFIAVFSYDADAAERSYECQILKPPAAGGSLENRKPMFDCACMSNVKRQIKKHWYPPKCCNGCSHPVVSFHVDEFGHARGVRLKKSSGLCISDEAAIKAVTDSTFEPLPFDVEFTFKFDYVTLFRPSSPALVLSLEDEEALPVVLVSTESDGYADCYKSYTGLNNRAVDDILRGNVADAKAELEEAHCNNPNYFPAKYNLDLLSRRTD